jgi:hypothetical protein
VKYPWRPPADRQRERKGEPSAASEAFLAARRTVFAATLESALDAAYKQVKLDKNKANEAVYQAFKAAFGRMLGETRAHCFTGNSLSGARSWMQQQAAQDVTKAQWLAVLKESNALRHAVVVEFRRMYQALELSGKFREIEVSESVQYADGTSIPTNHISDLCIWCAWAHSDVARGRWSTYVRKEFAENRSTLCASTRRC